MSVRRRRKTLGQIAYDSCPEDGGKANWGEWKDAPDVVRRVHEKMAKAVERTVKHRLAKQKTLDFDRGVQAAWSKINSLTLQGELEMRPVGAEQRRR